MADTTFVDFSQPTVNATWLNDINKAVYRAIGTGAGGSAPTTPADVRTNLGLTAGGGAALIGNTPAGTIAATTVQGAINEIVSDLASTGGAALVGNTPAGGVAATTVQAAINELDAEKISFTRLDDSDGSSLVGFLQDGVDAEPRTVQSKLRETVSVLDFGADPTGGTDSAAAIQAAFDSGAKEVILPTGTFLIGTTAADYISLTSAHNKVTFRGAGGVLKMAASTPLPSSLSAIEITDAQDILITGIRYDGNAPNNTENTASSTGLVSFSAARRSQRVIWTNNIVEQPNNIGTYVTDGSTECTVADNVFRNCFGGAVRIGLPDGSTIASAVVTGNTAVLDDNIHPTTAYQDGVMAQRWGGDVVWANNRLIIRSNVTSPPQMLFWLVRARRMIFTGNEVINEGSSGAYCIQGAITDDAEQIIIRGNNFASGQGILLTDSGGARNIDEVIIEGNRVLSSAATGITLSSTSSLTVGQAVISNNIVNYGGGQGIRFNSPKSTVCGNTVTRTGGTHGIFASGTSCVVSDNVIDMGGDVNRGIEIYGLDNVFTGNRVLNYTGIPIREQGSANWNLIHGNHTKGGSITTIGANTVVANNI